jgi:DNA-binding SARP family transcriptional activator
MALERQRLEQLILRGDGPSLITIVAPAGSGKTTLLARVAAISPLPVAWYLAAPEDTSGPAFVANLSRALSRAVSLHPDPAWTVEDLVSSVDALADGAVQLIIDDAHVLNGTPAQAALEQFLRLRPPQLRVTVGSRRPLGINAPRLLVSGALLELDNDSLRFRYWEVEDLFRTVYQEPLSPEAAAALTRQTGGWAAGLKLFQLATSGKSDAERFRLVTHLNGRSKLFRSYLTWNVLEELDPDRRTFLLFTSTLSRLTGPLCDVLLDRTGSATILDELERLQFFTVASEDGSYYRYHQVLQTHLEGLLVDELGVRAAADLHARSARLLEEAGHVREALRAYAVSNDWGSVARLLQQSDSQITLSPDSMTRLALPDDDPWLTLARARRLLRSGSVAAANRTYRRAESLLDDSDFVSRCEDERGLASPWLSDAVLLGARSTSIEHPASARGVVEMVRFATRRVRPTPSPGSAQAHPLAEGVSSLLAGRVAEARACLTTVVAKDSGMDGAETFSQLSAGLALTVAEIADGARKSYVSELEDLILSAELAEQTWLARVARGLQAAALLVARPEPWRADGCFKLIDECRADEDDWGVLLLAWFFATSSAAVGEHATARQWIEQMQASAQTLDAPVLTAWAWRLKATVARLAESDDADALATVAVDFEKAVGLADGAGTLERLLSGCVPHLPVDDVDLGRYEGTVPQRLLIQCLGNFQLVRDQAPLPLTGLRPRSRSLLLILAMNHGHEVHREVLIEALWPEAPMGAATHRLQVAVSNVRQCLAAAGLGDKTLQRHGDAYALVLPEAILDIAEFEQETRQAKYAELRGDDESAVRHWSLAVELYTDDLLPEAGPSEWVVGERDRLRLACAGAADAAARAHQRLGQLADALRLARRALMLEPMRDSAWSLLAQIQDGMGDLTAAEVTRREFRRVSHELEVDAPDSSTSVIRDRRPRPLVRDASRAPA